MSSQHDIGPQGLYHPKHEHDACGLGFIADIDGNVRHDIVQKGLQMLANLSHRGAVGADPLAGDGVGILTQIPDALFREHWAEKGVDLPQPGEYGVGVYFLPRDQASCVACMHKVEQIILEEGLSYIGWRDVPVDPSFLGHTVCLVAPVIRQIFVGRGKDIRVTDALERKLYVVRRRSAKAIAALKLHHCREFYVASFSARTLVYKGLLLSDRIGKYFLDLQNPRYRSALALVHQRFSTNTFPSWRLAHPFRFIAHNGEINTLQGNYNWMQAREKRISSPILGDDLEKLWPLIDEGQSDSASLDNVLELLVMGGYSLAGAMMLLIPEAWERNQNLDPSLKAFYRYYAAMMEPWDGPAAVVFTDGNQIGAVLDRNGLRPARYCETKDRLLIMASESGVLPVDDSNVLRKWRLQPGRMLLLDLGQKRIIEDEEIKCNLALQKPYETWVNKIVVRLDQIKVPVAGEKKKSEVPTLALQQCFGFSKEDVKFLIRPMMETGMEPIGAMGNDAPLAVLSQQMRSFYDYFHQRFAQVTNPPIDPIREDLVVSLTSYIGPKPNLLDIVDINPALRVEVCQPVLTSADMEKIRYINGYTADKFRAYEVDICYPVSWGSEGIEAQLASLCSDAENAVRRGYNILIVSDRRVGPDLFAIPALLALSAVHQHLVRTGLRTSTGLVVETGSVREVHHFALLAGYGAEAVHPYLALQTIRDLVEESNSEASETEVDAAEQKAVQNYIRAVGKGLFKVMSKMGISTYLSYTGAQIFEAVGLSNRLVNQYFYGTMSNIDGMGLFDVSREAFAMHRQAFISHQPALRDGGEYAYRVNGEAHMWTPFSIAKLQHAVRKNCFDTYQDYAQSINDQSCRCMTLRGLFDFRFDLARSVPLEEVEPASEIVKRFVTGAMSMGSISTEAHATLAAAMNRLGAKSNTGEGGEDVRRLIPIHQDSSLAQSLGDSRVLAEVPLKAGDSLRSRIKQVASGRFGVTIHYLGTADQIQIKIAQGAKPGEGGQLPGHKVSEYIGQLRHSVPGVGLISPPPHHDIYSIEDLAQLIHDLKNANPKASISVKLVSEVGVGTVAAGVVKAKADHVVIAGFDGGTGASPLSSIKHAGMPWELGLAETQQTLVLNRLRGRVRLQADGQMKTGRDIVIAALLGADECGFATAPLVAEGCLMLRKCHLNTCPVGIATQDPVLRQKFSGQPEHVINFFFFVAEEARRLMAQLGFKTFNEMIGRSEMLQMTTRTRHWKQQHLDFSKVFYRPALDTSYCHIDQQDHGLDVALDRQWIVEAEPALQQGEKVRIESKILNLNRTAGTLLSYEVSKHFGAEGLPPNTIHISLEGTAGQSLGAFLVRGICIDLQGEANDYVGKGLSGGVIIVRPKPSFLAPSHENVIVGNTVLYGATSGFTYFRGVAGERFLVRNSGATAVVEGIGDHGCEYMTGGTCLVLGAVGRNFGAGMSGGIAYVYDPKQIFEHYCNTSLVDLEALPMPGTLDAALLHGGEEDEAIVLRLLRSHHQLTQSVIAEYILSHWSQTRACFIKVFPREYRRVLQMKQRSANETGPSERIALG